MKVLVLNAGSSSMKFTLFAMTNEKVLAKGLVERVGTETPHLIYSRHDDLKQEFDPPVKNHTDALRSICDILVDREAGVIKDLSEVQAIGHRVVHGGERFTKPALVNANVKDAIRDCFALAPLHNPANLDGIKACETIFPGVPNIAVFDTAFHQSMPPEAYLYAVPYDLYTKYSIRRYGFHGTSHHFVAIATGKYLNKPFEQMQLITCHLGNGCSMAAISNGSVIDTSMGMTPLEGLVMGTRCGDIDPAVVLRLIELGQGRNQIDTILNKKSGLLGVAGIGSSDMRDIIAAEKNGDQQALRARRMFTRRVVKYIGSYYALLGGADAIIFTGGIGEWSSYVRWKIISRLACLGITIDKKKNDDTQGKAGIISTPESKTAVVVMPTNEELMIARSVAASISHSAPVK
ncbi:MAG: acetate kinase [Victivallaceae bacterium]|nr:acetate kinase [Victivallaceae bacterium]